MSFAGEIQNFSVVDVIQYLNSRHMTGNISFEDPGGKKVEIYFHEGQCIRGAMPGLTDIGSILRNQGHVSEEELLKAVKQQKQMVERKPLGKVMEEMKLVTHTMIRDAIVQQIEDVIHELMSWQEGSFKFEPKSTTRADDIGVALDDLVLPEEVNTVYLLMDAVRKFDEYARGKSKLQRQEIAQPSVETQDVSMAIDAATTGSFNFTFSLLKVMLLDIRKMEKDQNIGLQFLNVLSEHMERAILFMVREDSLRGLGGFGSSQGDQTINDFSKKMKIPLTEDSCLYDCVKNRTSYSGATPMEKWLHSLHNKLGRPECNEVVLIPVGGVDRVTFLVYGDNGTNNDSIQNLDLLEMAAAQTGVMMENVFLRKSLEKMMSRSKEPLEMMT